MHGSDIDFRKDEKQTELELSTSSTELFQYKTNYICTSVKSGLMLIDQHRAHFRVLYDRFFQRIKDRKGISQRVLFPEILELDANETTALNQILDELRFVGFDIELFGKNAFSINGVPSEIEVGSSISLLKELVTNVMNTEISVKDTIQNEIALLLSRHTAIQSGQALTEKEMNQLFEDLFQCENHVYSPDGKVIVSVISDEEIERKFR